MRMFDGFAGRLGWAKAFLARGWQVTAVDLVAPPDIPDGVEFIQRDMLEIDAEFLRQFDFACFSSPCEQFSLFGMRNFHANPPYPEMGIKLFNHTRSLCESSGLPYIMENVRSAQDFVGKAVNHCGPYYLWGTGVPPILPQGITKGFKLGTGATAKILKATGDWTALREYRKKMDCWHSSKSPQRIANTAKVATIPPELANCVADYAERILEQRRTA